MLATQICIRVELIQRFCRGFPGGTGTQRARGEHAAEFSRLYVNRRQKRECKQALRYG